MQLKKTGWLILVLLTVASLASCNIGKSPGPTPDVNGIFTSAAQTMVSQLNDQLTQTAAAVPSDTPTGEATFTSLPTFPVGLTPFSVASGTPFSITPIATPAGNVVQGYAVGCTNAVLVGQDPPDKTVIQPGKKFEVAWMLENAGTCAWDSGFKWMFKGGDKMNADPDTILVNQKDEFTQPGHSQTFIVTFTAPMTAKEYISYWQMKDDVGNWFGCSAIGCWIDIIVHK